MNFSDNAKRLETATIISLTETGMPTEEEILSLAGQLRNIGIYKVTDEEFDLVLRSLHQKLRIDMGIGARVVNDQTPWVQGRKSSIDPFYWNRYQINLRKQGLPPKVVISLDKVTDEILDLSGNPLSTNGWPRRGLVMGDVQSGKTSNYTGLICKAADSGYRLIILLTGTLESLRRQTQERLDAGFVGLDSSGIVSRNKMRREIGVGLIDGARAAGVFTSTLQDFRASTINQLGFRLEAFNEPVLLVVKKHKRILENLTEWLKNFNADGNGRIDLPMMLIDDEADNASVNTSPRKLRQLMVRSEVCSKYFPGQRMSGSLLHRLPMYLSTLKLLTICVAMICSQGTSSMRLIPRPIILVLRKYLVMTPRSTVCVLSMMQRVTFLAGTDPLTKLMRSRTPC